MNNHNMNDKETLLELAGLSAETEHGVIMIMIMIRILLLLPLFTVLVISMLPGLGNDK